MRKPYDGVGVQNGNGGGGFHGRCRRQGCGVVSYQILTDGTLDGFWGYWGVNERGSEKAERTGGSGIAGDYNLNGKNPNGSLQRHAIDHTERWRLRIRVEQ